jgi:hypothetical protein
MRHLSLDIETFASVTNASIAAVGAIVADEVRGPQGGLRLRILERFLVYVDDVTGVFSPRTIRWHAAQDDQEGNIGVGAPISPLGTSLKKLAGFLIEYGSKKEKTLAIWSHATFDIPRLADAYGRQGWPAPPWHYRNCVDLRTLYLLAGGRPRVPNPGKHNALADAEAQLSEIEQGLRTIRGESNE